LAGTEPDTACLGWLGRGLPVRSGDFAREADRLSLDALDPFGGGQRVWVVRAELASQMVCRSNIELHRLSWGHAAW
jgi:hypothetical protein